jgi:phosphopantothenoylcysteine synthetase/decarboxylase
MNQQQTKRVVYIISCGTPNAQQLYDLIPLLQSAHWDVCVVLTPYATRFVQQERLAQLTEHPVRSDDKRPEEPDVLPHADALVVYPATFNTINKWALGISDTLALGLLCEFTGMKLPILAIPVARKGKLAEHPALKRSLRLLRRYGIHILYDPEVYPPRNEVPNDVIVHELDAILTSIDSLKTNIG